MMNDAKAKKMPLKQRLVHETRSYLINFAYLAFVLGSFNWYKAAVLAERNIPYVNYGVPVIEALVLAKVVMIGDLLRIGHWVKGRPLIVPTLYRAVMFSIWVGLFRFLENLVRGLLRGEGLEGGIREFMSHSPYEMLAISLVTVLAFIPFFAFKEVAQVVGEQKLFALFLRRGPSAAP